MSYRSDKKKKAEKSRKVWYIVGLSVLFLSVILVTLWAAFGRKKQTTSDVTQLEEATLPTIRIQYNDLLSETELHGYVSEMTLLDMRDVIVPLDVTRTLNLSVQRYGNNLKSLEYQVRSLDGTEFIDGGTLTEVSQVETDTAAVEIHFTELLVSGTEYQLKMTLQTESKTIHYYTRMLYAKTMYVKELSAFAKEFSDATYDRDKASSFIVNYIQPEDSSQSNDYSYTDIHSKYAMLTYGNLEVTRLEGTLWRITEMEPTQVSLTLEYEISIKESDSTVRTFFVNEFFCIRIRQSKVYLLDYHRTLEEYFRPELSTVEKGRILLGVGDSDSLSVMNSDNNVYTVFVKGRELWSFNSRDNDLNRIFSFRSETDDSTRSDYNHHEVEVVKVSDTGDVDFMVYGYMNRGAYEGEVGILFYRYENETDTITGLFYMPVYQSEQILSMDLGTLAYVNQEDVCYIRYGNGIYSIDLNSGESVEVTNRAYPGMYAMNAKGNVVAWQEGTDLTYPERIVILNMDSQTTAVVNSESGYYIKIMDFFEDDIIYGFGRREDSVISANIDINQLLFRVVIASTDEKLTVQKDYMAKNSFVLSVDVYSTRIAIHRVKKENGVLAAIEDEVLLLTQNVRDDEGSSMVTARTNENFKKEYYIQIGRTTSGEANLKLPIAGFEVLKARNVIELLHQQENVYYVYGYGRVLYVESQINKAIGEAYDVFGTVLDEKMNTIWTRGTRDLVKTISIQPYTAEREDETLVAALRILCAQEGIQLRNGAARLDAGESPIEIINDSIGAGSAVNLYGCTLSEALYFVNSGHPCIAITGNRTALVITGYDTDTVSVYNPFGGTTVKMKTDVATAYFEGLNKIFITYK